jgi:hypothetical protein
MKQSGTNLITVDLNFTKAKKLELAVKIAPHTFHKNTSLISAEKT